eukprot:CAMPEP_0202745728 /NCGR_PEP_ID=MMETSP1388-20130828/7599_1 /ASSEMBLY_ACC=CAM_ASM_000864 /TAXON_ID=37098 /ORGANISM="Isochrysis sp, Strain CCMP1244" /LENGTH=87 /DNA_ID=CAMNT_0049412937 /DNA_START=383 /DNA_END=642 /DNA_ORIENTATION=+
MSDAALNIQVRAASWLPLRANGKQGLPAAPPACGPAVPHPLGTMVEVQVRVRAVGRVGLERRASHGNARDRRYGCEARHSPSATRCG